MEKETRNAFLVSRRRWECGKITKAEILKETSLTYVAKGDGITWTFKKSEMKIQSYILALSYREALAVAMEEKRDQFRRNNHEMEALSRENEKLAEEIAELEKERVHLNDEE